MGFIETDLKVTQEHEMALLSAREKLTVCDFTNLQYMDIN